MSRTRTLVVAVAIASLTGGALTSTAQAAPASSGAIRTVLVKRLVNADKQYVALSRRVKICPSGKAFVVRATKMRRVAMNGWQYSTKTQLRARHIRLRGALVQLLAASRRCGVKPVTRTVVVTPGGSGSGSSSGSGTNVTVTPSPGLPGVSITNIPLTVRNILGGELINLSSVLSGTTLPGTVQLVDASQLTLSPCADANNACVGIDGALLKSNLAALSSGVLLVGPILAQLNGLIDSGNLGAILQVERVSDDVVRVAPIGALATLTALIGSVGGAQSVGALLLVR